MAIKYSFLDSTVYGTEDINDIARSLVGAGVAPFVSKSSYKVSDLNSITSAIVGAGVSLDGCKCSIESVGTAQMNVRVSQGIVFFESGVRLEVDGNGYTVAAAINTAGYIYVYFSPSLQKADIVFGSKLPTDGECVLLAEVSESGSLIDKRTFARSKVATMGSNATCSITEDRITVYDNYDVAPVYNGSANERILAEIDLAGIDITKFNYLIYQYKSSNTSSTGATICQKYYNFKKYSKMSFYVKGSLYYHSAMLDIILDKTKFLIVMGAAVTYDCYKTAVLSAIPYFELL